jgi:hypothetical protein
VSEIRELKIVGHIKQYVPPLTNGDNDWDEGFDCKVIGESELYNDNTVRIRVYMLGTEREQDWTRVEGWSDWQDIYYAPSGWKIRSVTPLGSTSREYGFGENEHLKVFEDAGAGAIVSKFEIHGFQGDNPHTAGWYTRVVAYFNSMNVVIEN